MPHGELPTADLNFTGEKPARRVSNPCLAGRGAGARSERMPGSEECGAAGRPAAPRALLCPFMSARGRELPARGRGPRTMRRFLPHGRARSRLRSLSALRPPGNEPEPLPAAPVHGVAPWEAAGAGVTRRWPCGSRRTRSPTRACSTRAAGRAAHARLGLCPHAGLRTRVPAPSCGRLRAQGTGIRLFKNLGLDVSQVPGPVVGPGDSTVNKTEKSPRPPEGYALVRDKTMNINLRII